MGESKVPLPWAGLISGATAWAASTQTNYALAGYSCSVTWSPVIGIAAVLMLFSLAGSAVSFAAWRKSSRLSDQLVTSVSALCGLIFAAVILTQGSAALILTGCER